MQAEQASSAELRQEVKQLQSQLDERRRALQSSQRQLAETQNKLAQARQSEDKGLAKLLENQLLTQEEQINSQRTQIASLEQRSG